MIDKSPGNGQLTYISSFCGSAANPQSATIQSPIPLPNPLPWIHLRLNITHMRIAPFRKNHLSGQKIFPFTGKSDKTRNCTDKTLNQSTFAPPCPLLLCAPPPTRDHTVAPACPHSATIQITTIARLSDLMCIISYMCEKNIPTTTKPPQIAKLPKNIFLLASCRQGREPPSQQNCPRHPP